MATSVDLVRAYLHVNGYFTVTEYPVLERLRKGVHQMVTDLDVLAFRLRGAGPSAAAKGDRSRTVAALQEPDPVLGRGRGESDMIVAEVKEGNAELNRAAREPHVLQAALVRFGCCNPAEVSQVVARLLRKGDAETEHGHRVRMFAFGSRMPHPLPGNYTVISLDHVVSFLQSHLRDHWDVVRNAQILDPALGFLSLLEKAGRSDSS